MKIALCLIVKPSDDEAEVLDRCLENTKPYVDGIFVTITGKNERCEQVANKHNAVISHFDWVDDFAKARNYNFSQVPKDYDYILWCDADDVFRNLEYLRDNIEKSPADAYSMFYLYAFDEANNPVVVHAKTQVIRNDGCVEWAGALHEDFKENRKITAYFLKGIERLHLSNDKRFEQAKERNLTVALKMVADKPEDPRSYWNLGNSYKAMNKNTEALEAFEKFMKMSQSDDEKYIAYIRMAESLWNENKRFEAVDKLRFAIGLKPEFPDAYNLIGAFYVELGDAKNAIEYLKTGLQKKPPYYSIIVFNPRDYDYVPLMNLAKAYFQISMPTLALGCLKACQQIYPDDKKLTGMVREMKKQAKRFEKVSQIAEKLLKIEDKNELKREFGKIPDEFNNHPLICKIRNTNFLKETSSGRDLVFYCAYTAEEWTPQTALTKGIGGSEEAVINLSKELTKLGWNVTVYNNCGHKDLEFDGVKYKPFWSFNYRDKQDVVIIWRHPLTADYNINADKVFLDLHDVIPDGEFTRLRLANIDKVFVKSEFHKSLFPSVPEEKFVIIPNGINSSQFNGEDKDEFLMINTSSPDRSLRTLVDVFPEVKKEIPQAKCYWAYGWNVFDATHAKNKTLMQWKEQLVKDMDAAGITNLGRLGHSEVNKLYNRARIFAYPSEFAEIDCISLTKALAGGAVPVTSDFAAMGEKAKYGGLYQKSEKTKNDWCKPYQYDFSLQDRETFKNNLIRAFKEQIKIDSEQVKQDYNWENIALKWHNELCYTKS